MSEANEQLLRAAESLAVEFRERADEIERARRIPADIAQHMGEAGFYRMGAPASIDVGVNSVGEVFVT